MMCVYIYLYIRTRFDACVRRRADSITSWDSSCVPREVYVGVYNRLVSFLLFFTSICLSGRGREEKRLIALTQRGENVLFCGGYEGRKDAGERALDITL